MTAPVDGELDDWSNAMPLRIVMRDNVSGPLVFCDQCNREIKTAKDGNFEWQAASDGAKKIFFTHKTCSDAFRRAHPEVRHSDELTVFPIYLSDNLDIDLKAARKAADRG